MSTPILRSVQTANKPTVYDLTIDLSDWSCDTDICGISGPCDACARRERIAKLLAVRDLRAPAMYAGLHYRSTMRAMP